MKKLLEYISVSESSVDNIQPRNKQDLIRIIKDRIREQGPKCDLNDIDVSRVTDMSGLFSSHGLDNFNGDISGWDVSNVRTMTSMFEGSKFTGDISGWDVSNVESMYSMFSKSRFNGDISQWDVRHVEDMRLMFFMSMFKGDISDWDVQEDTDMESMFNQSSLERANKLPAWYNNSTMTI